MSNELRSMTGPPCVQLAVAGRRCARRLSREADRRGQTGGPATGRSIVHRMVDAVTHRRECLLSLTGEPHPTVEMAMAGWRTTQPRKLPWNTG